jgi:hypothetical protein
MSTKSKDILRVFNTRRIILAIVLGLSAASYMLYKNFDKNAFLNIQWGWEAMFWLFMALLMMVLRDLGYIIRIRILSDKLISWRHSFDVVML